MVLGTVYRCLGVALGHFEKLICDAYQRMKATGAFIWGLSTSQNPRFMSS